MGEHDGVCAYSQDWPDFDFDYDLRNQTAMPYCTRFLRRVTPSSDCGSANCSSFTPVLPLSAPARETPRKQLTLPEQAARLCNTLMVKKSDDNDNYQWQVNVSSWYGFPSWGCNMNSEEVAKVIREHYQLLRRLDTTIRRLGYCKFVTQRHSKTSEHVQESVEGMFAIVTKCLENYHRIRQGWDRCKVANYYLERLPRMREIVADMESAAERFDLRP